MRLFSINLCILLAVLGSGLSGVVEKYVIDKTSFKEYQYPTREHSITIEWIDDSTWTSLTYEDVCSLCSVDSDRHLAPVYTSKCEEVNFQATNIVMGGMVGGSQQDSTVRMYELPKPCARPPWDSDPDFPVTEEMRANYCRQEWIELKKVK